MPAYVYHRIDQAALRKLLTDPGGGVYKDLLKRGIKIESQAKKNLQNSPRRVDTGRLRGSITHQMFLLNGNLAVRVGTGVKYARFVHDGTGLYGPRASLIYPKTKKALKWTGKKGVVYARYTRGMKPNPFLKNALKAGKT